MFNIVATWKIINLNIQEDTRGYNGLSYGITTLGDFVPFPS